MVGTPTPEDWALESGVSLSQSCWKFCEEERCTDGIRGLPWFREQETEKRIVRLSIREVD